MAPNTHIHPDDERTVAPSRSGARRGLFVTFEGGDGAGKTTHIGFLASALRDQGCEVVHLREPGGTAVGERLRGIVLDPASDGLAAEAELLVYEAARAQLVSQVVRPALERGAVVLCDRFTDSTLAYQGYGRGIPLDVIERLNEFACGGVRPDRTILLVCDGPAACGLARATAHAEADRLELAGPTFHDRVNEGFLDLARRDPSRIRVVSSSVRRPDAARAVFSQLKDLFPWMARVIGDDAFFAGLDCGAQGRDAEGGACG